MTEVQDKDITIKLSEEQLMRKRVIYVGDRVAFGVIFSFLLLIGYILLVFRIDNIFLIIPWFFLFILLLGFTFWIWYILTNDDWYYSKHIFANSNFLFVQLIWICWMSFVSSFFALFYGWQHILEVTLLYMLLYIVGYSSGRTLWYHWNKISKNAKIYLILIIILGTLITTFIFGMYFLNIGELRICAYIFIFGLGSLGSMGLNVFMLYLYYDKSGNDVWEDPPSMLVIIGIINTLIVSFIVWLIMILFLPLIPGSKRGGRKTGGGGGKFHKTSRARFPRYYRTRRYYFFGPKVEEERPSVNYYWIIAMGVSATQVSYKRSEIDEAKSKIVDLLFEEEIVPSQKDLQKISEINQPLLDFAIDELTNEKKIKYIRTTSSHWWTKGYCLTEDFNKELIKERGEIDVAQTKKEFNEKIDKLLETIRRKQPIRSKYQLWDLAIEIGLSPKWKITPTLNKLLKEKKIRYSRKAPRGYYIP